jgi:hypothetical protein
MVGGSKTDLPLVIQPSSMQQYGGGMKIMKLH